MIDPITGFLLGLAGGLHCAGMCGPIAMALPSSGGTRGRVVAEKLFYQFGRIGTYATLGLIAGYGASVFDIAGYGRVASLVAGTLMVVTAIMQLVWHRSLFPSGPLHRIADPLRRELRRLLHQHSFLALLGIGACNGLLPCGLVVSALLGSASTTEPLGGAIFMATFGIGTLPVMMSIALGGGFLTQRLKKTMRFALPIMAIAIGSIVILRGMALDIPYVSPPEARPNSNVNCCEEP